MIIAGPISMPYKSVPAVLILLLFCSCDKQDGADYFPLQEGAYWRYRLTYETMDGPAATLYVIENLPAEIIEGETIHTRRALDGRLFHYQELDDGLLMTNHEITLNRQTKSWRTNHYVFKYPIEPGRKWEGRSRSRVLIKTGPPQKTEFRIVANVPVTYEIESMRDTVKVPAGTFENCLRISLKGSGFFNAGNDVGKTIVSIKEQNWYAPGVGLVKSLREERTTSRSLDRGTMVLELEYYK